MANDFNSAIIKRTQESLGKYVKKPSLTEKLLKKPPFRFLHDVFSVVIRDTGCFEGLYTPAELTFENIKDRDDKMGFLQKMIDVVKLTTNSSTTVRTSKIVAGQEPEKTNELLQLMGEIIEKKLDWQSAVEQVLLGKTPRNESPTKPTKDSKAVKDSNTKPKHKEKSKEKESKIKDATKTSRSTTKATTSSSNKDDKNKRTNERDKTSSSKPTATTKDKITKKNKEQDKTVRKSSKEATNAKSRLTKTESQSSYKSSPSPNTQESNTTSLKNSKTENNECNHDEMPATIEDKKLETSLNDMDGVAIKKKEVAIDNEIANSIIATSPKMESPERSSSEKPKKSSGKARKSSGHKKGENHIEAAPQVTENIPSLESHKPPPLQSEEKSEKSEIIESKAMPPLKQDPLTKPPQKQPSPPTSLINEAKRENTFIRENSKESSSNQSSITNRPRTSLRPPSARPPSARPGAPRRRDKNVEIILQPNDQIKMSGIQVKLETFGDLDDDGENLVIIENPNANDVATEPELNLTESEKMMQDETLEQGHLVQQILETQKELIQQNDANGQQKNDKDSTNGLVMRQTSARHMNNLRDVIQNLTKSVNPLGKLMDFIPEDIDAMQLEFTMWRDAYTQAAVELKRERSLTESATEPMKNQLVQIEANIVEYLEMIDASRVKILQNTEKILKMLTTS